MILLKEDEIRKLKLLQGINCGSSGRCYYYNEDEVIKLLYSKDNYLIGNVKSLLGLSIEDVSFPIDRTDLRRNYFAYTMPLIEGENLWDLREKILKKEFDLSLSEISTIYNSCKEKVIKAADMGIQVGDMNLSNILVKDNLKAGLIDVDRWVKNDNEKNKKNNITHLNGYFYSFLLKFYTGSNLHIVNKVKQENNYNYVDEIIDYTHIKRPSIKKLGQFRRSPFSY